MRGLAYILSQRRPGILLAMVLDALVTIESMLVAVLFRFEGMVPEGYWNRSLLFALFAAVVLVILLLVGGAYRGASLEAATATAISTVIATGVLILVNLGIALVWARPVPPSVILVGGGFILVQLVALRLYARAFRERSGA